MRTQLITNCFRVLASTVVFALCSSLMTAQALEDWDLYTEGVSSGAYDCGGDPTAPYDSDDVGYMIGDGAKSNGFGTWMCTIDAEDYRSKRIQLSAYVKTEDVNAGAMLWMRVDGKNHKILAFDNMQRRAIRGTTDWSSYTIVLDVPVEAEKIALGTILGGNGKVWTGSLELAAVSAEVPVTDLGSPTDMLRPPKDVAAKLALLKGHWEGRIHQTMGDGTEFDWPVEMDCSTVLNTNTIQMKGVLHAQGDFTVDWIGMYSWDSSQKRMVYFEATSTGETAALKGNWRQEQVPTLELSDLESTEGHSAQQIITIPDEGKMLWELTWQTEDGVIRQLLDAERK
ncbi:hypothetical protein KQI65_15870 [bacterium]|nr:hypothetical protein [bacterium]